MIACRARRQLDRALDAADRFLAVSQGIERDAQYVVGIGLGRASSMICRQTFSACRELALSDKELAGHFDRLGRE